MALSKRDIIPFSSVGVGFENASEEMLEARSLGIGRPLTDPAAPYEIRSPGDGKIYQRRGDDSAWDFIGYQSQPYFGVPRPSIQIEGFELAYGDFPTNSFGSTNQFTVKPGRIILSGNGPLAQATNGLIEYAPTTNNAYIRKTISPNPWQPGNNQPAHIRTDFGFYTLNCGLAVWLLRSRATGALDVCCGRFVNYPELMTATEKQTYGGYEIDDFTGIFLPSTVVNAAGGPWDLVCRIGYLPVQGNTNVLKFIQKGATTIISDAAASTDAGELITSTTPTLAGVPGGILLIPGLPPGCLCNFSLTLPPARYTGNVVSLWTKYLNGAYSYSYSAGPPETYSFTPVKAYYPDSAVRIAQYQNSDPNPSAPTTETANIETVINLSAYSSFLLEQSAIANNLFGDYTVGGGLFNAMIPFYASITGGTQQAFRGVTFKARLLSFVDVRLPRAPYQGRSI